MQRATLLLSAVLAMVCLVLTGAVAQTTGNEPTPWIMKSEIGIMGGLNMATTSEDIAQYQGTHSFLTSYHVGALYRYWLIRQLALQVWLLYNVKGGKQEYASTGGGGTGKFEEQLTYLSLPITAMYTLPLAQRLWLGLFGGPELAYLLSAKFKQEYTYGGQTTASESEGVDDLNRFEFALIVGALIQYQLESFAVFFAYSYAFGLTTIHKDAQYNSKNRVMRFSLGVTLPM
jgi:hypothetical protein